MPRKQRIEFPGAVYHIISRGNYRKKLFVDEGTAFAFEQAILATVRRCGWVLYAYVIMQNHYHLAIRTPTPNLVEGMKWLQGTFATRFNRLHNERGHVFEGRYKSLIVGENRPLLGLIDYIHLNPVRANLCALDRLRGYSLSSFPRYFQRPVPAPLDRAALLALCGLPDAESHMQTYLERLKIAVEGDPAKREELSKAYCQGWFLGSAEAKNQLSADLARSAPDVDWGGAIREEIKEVRWEHIVTEEMTRMNLAESDIASSLKGADWKVHIAKRLRRETTAGNPWITQRLHMGHPNYVSNLVNKDSISN